MQFVTSKEKHLVKKPEAQERMEAALKAAKVAWQESGVRSSSSAEHENTAIAILAVKLYDEFKT